MSERTSPDNREQPTSLAQDLEVLTEFLAEANEHVLSIENNLIVLEQAPANSEALQAVFRSFHSIKGLAGFLEFPTLQEVSHEVENLLDLARKGSLIVDSRAVDLALAGADYIKRSAKRVAAMVAGSEVLPEEPGHELVERVRAFVAATLAEPEELTPAVAAHHNDDERPAEDAQDKNADSVTAPADAAAGADSVVRVHTSKLDYLVDMVGEMVIAQSLLRHDPELAQSSNARLLGNLAQLRRVTAEIQKTTMSMRMIPIGHLFRRTARMVRDLSRKVDKQVELSTIGEDTELDRTIIEELADPLMHMIRNSIDHGIESPGERETAGKPRTARIGLKAYHQAGHIVIEVSDDGRGIDRQKVIRKAREMGLIIEGAELSDRDVYQLIFHAGFSTAQTVTDVSGRGVGMDVVRKHVEKLRGRIHIESTPGAGTTFFLKLPLTLAIVDGLVVGVGSERYVIPIFAVREVLRPSSGMVSTIQNRGEMALVRDTLLPVVRLCQQFHVRPDSECATDGILIVSDNAGKRFCLLVDRLLGKQEVIIKGMGEMLKNIAGIAGSAILGDGQVGLILDMDALLS